jgi:hypothetical protein
MEAHVFSNMHQECIDIKLQPNEELSIHFIKTSTSIDYRMILYTNNGECILTPFHIYYDEGYLEYLFLLFRLETMNMIEFTLIMDYDREQKQFIIGRLPDHYE